MAEVAVKRLEPKEVNYVIYHNNCSDGYASRVIAEQILGTEKVTYFGATYGQDPPKDLEGKNLLMVDFSYPKLILDKLLTKVKNLLILDHHRSAQKDLEGLAAHYKVFDMKESGASLTWRYFHPGEEMPYFLQLIKEHDIWIETAPLFKEFSALLPILPFDEYRNLLSWSQLALVEHVQKKATNLLKMMEVQIDQAVDHAWVHFQYLNKTYYLVATVNSTVYPSEVGSALVRKCPAADFAAVYSLTKTGETKFSLRSTDVQADTIPVAKYFLGGGHDNRSIF